MRIDILLIIIGLLLIAAMTLTLLYGKENSRHGYGANKTLFQQRAIMVCLLPARLVQGPPCKTGSPFCAQEYIPPYRL